MVIFQDGKSGEAGESHLHGLLDPLDDPKIGALLHVVQGPGQCTSGTSQEPKIIKRRKSIPYIKRWCFFACPDICQCYPGYMWFIHSN